MKRFVLCAACAAFLIASPSYAKSDQFLTVTGPPSLELWAKHISRSLDETMRYPSTVGRVTPTGVVRISFSCSDAGIPSDVTVIEKSKYKSIDLAAMRAIKNLKSLHPLPANMSPKQVYHADLFFAESVSDLQRMQHKWKTSAHSVANGSNVVRFAVLTVR